MVYKPSIQKTERFWGGVICLKITYLMKKIKYALDADKRFTVLKNAIGLKKNKMKNLI